jgi:hypothetical protein
VWAANAWPREWPTLLFEMRRVADRVIFITMVWRSHPRQAGIEEN